MEVARVFLRLLMVGDTESQVNEVIIVEATHLPMAGEKWPKNLPLKGIPSNEFLVSKKITYNRKGIPVTNLKCKWPSSIKGDWEILIEHSSKMINREEHLKKMNTQNQIKSNKLARKLA
jgi:hypothetical protein